MIERVNPNQYFIQMNNQFKEGLMWGAFLILLGIVVGSLIVYIVSRKG